MFIPINKIQHRRRLRIDQLTMNQLIGSIKRYGILVELSVMKLKNGRYRLLDGQHRLIAAKAAKLTEVPCRIIRFSDHSP